MGMVLIDAYILYSLAGWTSLLTGLVFIARRDFVLGIKKWFLMKRGAQPVVLRYYGPNMRVSTYLVSTRGRDDTVTIEHKRFFGLKKSDFGKTFFLDEKTAYTGDDNVPELNYSYRSVAPLVPGTTAYEHASRSAELKRRGEILKSSDNPVDEEALKSVDLPVHVELADPVRLNSLLARIRMSAKAQVLSEKSEDVLKFVKYSFYASVAAAGVGVLIWWTLDTSILPELARIASLVADVGRGVINA